MNEQHTGATREAIRTEFLGMNEWESWIGRTSTAIERLDPAQANHLNVTLDREPSLVEGDVLPPAWHWLYFHDVVRASDLGEAGHPRLGVTMPPVPLPRRMWAGGTLEFAEEPLRLGTSVERISTIRSIIPKNGRTGPLYFVTVEHELRAGGTRSLFERQTIAYREMSSTAEVPRARPAPTDATFSTDWSLDATALFRYSALTFNGHRIHYDVDHCRTVEGYPNLVVHGPLIATLLLDLAVREGRPLVRFTYRAKNPLFLPQPFAVNGRPDGDGTVLWASNHQGGLAMEAEVRPA
jgi:3-methylfumaryl-CoA hydratase